METLRLILALPAGLSSFADGIDLLHLFVISVTMLLSVYVFASAAWYTVRWYRGDTANAQTTLPVPKSRAREASLIVVVLGTFLLWWVIGFTQYAHMADPPENATTIVVTAKQWMWQFTYPDGSEAEDVLTVPVDRDIRLLMTSRDVIHSFYVPQFRVKHDILPGRWVTTWFRATKIGEADIFCAEYCGTSHSRMLGRVVVLSQADYQKWLADRRGTADGEEMARRGVAVATRHGCVACHTFDGQPHIGPTWARLYGSVVKLEGGRTTIADEAYLTRSMMEPNADIVAGFRPVMPSFAGQLPAGDVGALVELIRSLRTGPIAPEIRLPRLEIVAVDGGAPP